MNETDFRVLLATLSKFENIHTGWNGLLVYWISRADGFLELMTFEDEESNTASFLVEKLVQLLSDVHPSATDQDLLNILAQDFELLFFRAQYGSDMWDSTQETLTQFILRHNMKSPNQLIVDEPHTDAASVKAWLETLLNFQPAPNNNAA